MSAGVRFRLVTVQGGREHVSSVVLNAEEAVEAIDAEAHLHAGAGWSVFRNPGWLLCIRGGTHRTISTRAFSPLEDAAGGTPHLSPAPGRNTLEER